MKPYGHSRRDKLECKYGCCTGKSGKHRMCRLSNDRAKRKAARRVDLQSEQGILNPSDNESQP